MLGRVSTTRCVDAVSMHLLMFELFGVFVSLCSWLKCSRLLVQGKKVCTV